MLVGCVLCVWTAEDPSKTSLHRAKWWESVTKQQMLWQQPWWIFFFLFTAFSVLSVYFSSQIHLSPSASPCPPFLFFFLTGGQQPSWLLMRDRAFAVFSVCLRVCITVWGRKDTERVPLFVCGCTHACVGILQKGKARSRKRKSEKDKGRCALQLSSLDLFPLCY